MPVQRHFLGWDKPLTESVCNYLMPGAKVGSLNLEDTLIIVPTREAGRRLREALAARCAATGGGALLSANVVVTSALFRPVQSAETRETSGLLTRAIWAEVLEPAPSESFPALFPSTEVSRDFAWAERMGENLQRLRETLADGGHTITGVLNAHEEELEELDRWRDLAKAEGAFLSRVDALGYHDATLRKIEQAANPNIPEGITRIVVASVPDPSLLMIQALDVLQKRLPVEILIIAPPEEQALFDKWGRPIPDAWRDRSINIPDEEQAVILTASPKSQAEQTLQAIAESADSYGPGDIVIGVPDRSVIPFLETTLTEIGIPVFDPADRFIREHPLYELLDSFVSLANSNSYTALRNCVRHPDTLTFLVSKGIDTNIFLEALDNFQNSFIPLRLEHISARINTNATDEPEATLAKGIQQITNLLATFRNRSPVDAVRDLFQTIYASRKISSKQADDQTFATVAETIVDVLRECAESNAALPAHDTATSLHLMLRRLSEMTYHIDGKEAGIDLDGWLELPWNDAALLIATGMNEGHVPDGRLSDMFLPDSLRHRLGLRNDDARLARDAYVMTTIIESRRASGTTRFIVGKTSAAGDPLKPSRLLFRCPQEALIRRAEALFAPIEEQEPHHASTISFKLDPLAPLNGKLPVNSLKKLSVTAFRSYLTCPFRFYLGNILKMQTLDDAKRELDALDFGSMVHHALEEMGSQQMWACDDEHKLADFLIAHIEALVSERFPQPPPLPVQITLDAARQRLRQAAATQVALVREGWELIRSEARYEMEIEGMRIRGTIDRIDKHRDSGKLRIIDYKTSDSAISPLDAHVANVRDDTPDFAILTIGDKKKRWLDLQLPLYYRLLQVDGILNTDSIELAYFNLPKSVLQTGILTWENWTPDLLDAADDCAKVVVQSINNGIFWPPSGSVKYDDFELLFPADPEACFLPIPSPGGDAS